MDILDFERTVEKHSLKPYDNLYNTVGLCGEAGEVANIIKKIAIRKSLPPEDIASITSMQDYISMLYDELGDVLFYFVRLASDNGISLSEIMQKQHNKLQDRSKEFNKTFLK